MNKPERSFVELLGGLSKSGVAMNGTSLCNACNLGSSSSRPFHECNP